MKLFDKTKKSVDEPPTFIDRVLAAILIPIAFNLSILIILALILGSSGARIFNHYKLINKAPADLILITTILMPAVVGFMIGLSKSSTLFGHFFYTNEGSEKDIYKTVGIWGCLFLITYCISEVL